MFPLTVTTNSQFAFRELAFAILSLAAGVFSFDRRAHYYGRPLHDRFEGYVARRDSMANPHSHAVVRARMSPARVNGRGLLQPTACM